MSFAESYVGKLRQKIGNDLLILPGASCLCIDDAGRFMLERRSDFGIWGVPGGSPEAGDDVTSLMRREMLEETGVELHTLTPYGFASDPLLKTIVYPNGHQCQYFVMLFCADWPAGALPVVSPESLEFGWFTLETLPADIMPSARSTIEAYQRFKATGVFQLV